MFLNHIGTIAKIFKILGIIEKIIEKNKDKKRVISKIRSVLESLLNDKLKKDTDNEYDLIWLIYFVKSLGLFTIDFPKKINSPLIKSLKVNHLEFFKPVPKEMKLFDTIKNPGKNRKLLDHLALFKRSED